MVGLHNSIKILEGKKLYRDVVIENKIYRGSRDVKRKRNITYITSIFPKNYFLNKTILDLGCAGGAVCFHAALQGSKKVVGIERDDDCISGAMEIMNQNNLQNIEFLKLDLNDFLSKNTKKFDVIFALNILHHMDNPFLLLDKIRRICKKAICIETPVDDIFEPGLNRVVKSLNQDYIAYLENYGFSLKKELTSHAFDRNFYGGKRIVYLFEVNKEKKIKLKQLEKYRDYRDECKTSVYSNPSFLPIAVENLSDYLKQLSREKKVDNYSNFLLIGPHASGKTYLLENSIRKRIIKKAFKDAERLDIFLNPDSNKCNLFSYLDPNHNLDEAIERLKGNQRIICIVCFCDFDTHVTRLSERERVRKGTGRKFPEYDEPLQYDYIALLEKLSQNNIKFFIVDTGYGHDTLYEKYYGKIPWYKKYRGFLSKRLVEKIGRELEVFIYFLRGKQFKKMTTHFKDILSKLLKNRVI